MPHSTVPSLSSHSPHLRVIRDEDAPPYDEQAQPARREPVVIMRMDVGETILATMGPAPFAVYWHLSKRAKNGQCWPSLDDIAEATKQSRKHVTRVLDQLEEGGWITRTKRTNAYGMATSTLYTLTVKPCTDGCDTDETKPGQGMVLNVTRTSNKPVRELENVKTTTAKKERVSAPDTPVPDNLLELIPGDVWQAMKIETRLTDEQLRFETSLMIDRNLRKGGTSKNWLASWRSWMRSQYRQSQPAPSSNGAWVPSHV